MKTRVLSHALKHGLNEEEVIHGWLSPIRCRQRNGTDDPAIWIAVGVLPDGRMVELVAFLDADACWCVFHAKTPPTKKFITELRLKEGRHGND
jgi:hypothetical protein